MNPRSDPDYLTIIPDREALENSIAMSRSLSSSSPSRQGSPSRQVRPIVVMPLNQLLALVSKGFDRKIAGDRAAFLAVRNREVVLDFLTSARTDAPKLVPLAAVMTQLLSEAYGAKAATAKARQLAISCSKGRGHASSHPRVEVFRRMAGYGGEAEWTTAQEMAILQLQSWMGLCDTDPKKSMRDTHLTPSQFDVLLGHLIRLFLIPKEARPFLRKVAVEMAAETQRGPRGDQLDADSLVLRLITAWGGWDDKDSLSAVLRPNSPSPSSAAASPVPAA